MNATILLKADEVVFVNDSASNDIETLWAAFREVVCKPYYANSERLLEIEGWFNELYARRQQDDLGLSHCRLEVAGSPLWFLGRGQKTKTIDVFCLNIQMYFSTDFAVLTIPYVMAVKDAEKHSDRFIGVWLHDFGKLDEATRKILDLKTYIVKRDHFPAYVIRIFDTLGKELSDRWLPGKQANIPLKKGQFFSWQMRVHHDWVGLDGASHRDTIDSKDAHKKWSRVFSHSLWGAGTQYHIGNKENITVICPPGATSSHTVSDGHHLGALHNAQDGGRSILIGSTRNAKRLTESPWRVFHLNA